MILDNETKIKYGKTFEEAFTNQKIICKCDYCGEIFERMKSIIIRTLTSPTHSCGKKECKQKKYKDSMIVLTGVEHPMFLKETKIKIKETCLENYGVENPFQSEIIKTKIKEKNRENLGVDYPMQSEKTKEKAKQKWLENLGVDNPQKSKKVFDKTCKTNEERYGKKCVFESEEIKEKSQKTCERKYGKKNASQAKCVREKREQTFKDRYGVRNPTLSPEIMNRIYENNNKKYGQPHPPRNYKCENEIKNWLNSFGFNFQTTWDIITKKDGRKLQLDMYSPDLKIGVEFCGLYWHTDLSKTPRGRDSHFSKYKNCEEKNIKLITIFEDEWKHRNIQCKNFLKSVLGISEKKIFARKCTIIELSKEQFNKFIDENHIQKPNNLNIIRFGLIFKDKLIAAMSLGRHNRQNGVSKLVLDRFCCKDGIQIAGGASKLFSKCIEWAKNNNYKEIISFSDNRWSEGNIYKVLNFTLDKELPPSYDYVNLKTPSTRIKKQSRQKKKIGCPSKIKEHIWMAEKGYGRIWDCGKKRWKYTIN